MYQEKEEHVIKKEEMIRPRKVCAKISLRTWDLVISVCKSDPKRFEEIVKAALDLELYGVLPDFQDELWEMVKTDIIKSAEGWDRSDNQKKDG